MILKMRAGLLVATVLLLVSFRGQCQNQWTYDFNNAFNAIEKEGPALRPLGQPGQIVKEKLPGSDYLTRSLYVFQKNSGLQFNNALTKGFLNKSFTVELYFKFDEVDGRRRVLDFKNRKTDNGTYIEDSKVIFFDFAKDNKIAAKPDRWVHYVYSRDHETKIIKIYINGLLRMELKDPGKEGLLDQDQVLNIFQDDLMLGQEASSGSVALIRIYDRVMTPVFVRRSYQTIAKSFKDIEEGEEKVEPVATAETPSRNSNKSLVTGRVYDGTSLKPVNGADVTVRKSDTDSLVAQTKTVEGIYTFELTPHESYKISASADGFQSKSIAIKTQNRFEEIKSLISLSAETYSAPLVTVYFTQGTETLEAGGQTGLDEIAAYFAKHPDLNIRLKGHTDNAGDFNKNLELSNKRVETVKTYLTGKGISGERILGTGYGSAQPNRVNRTEALKKTNRRVEIWAEPVKR